MWDVPGPWRKEDRYSRWTLTTEEREKLNPLAWEQPRARVSNGHNGSSAVWLIQLQGEAFVRTVGSRLPNRLRDVWPVFLL